MKGLLLTYLLTVVGAVASLRYPLIGLQIYIGFAVLRPQAIFGWAGDLSNISLIVAIGMLIGWILQGFGSWRFRRGLPAVVALLLYAVWYVISATQALHPEGSLGAVQEFAKTMLPFLVGVTLMKEDNDWRKMLWTIVLAQGYVGFELNLDYIVKGWNNAAVGFGGMDNNFLGLSLVTTIGPAVALAIGSRNWIQRLLASASAVLILHSALLTFSRGAMVGLVAVAFTAFVMMPKRPTYMAGVLLTVLLAVRLTGPELAARYLTVFNSEEQRDESAESREDLWRDCMQVIEAYPVFGVGPWNWSRVVANFGWPEGKSAHSVWMETAAETGVPGFLFLTAFFGITVIRLLPLARARPTETNRDEIVFANGVILSLVGFGVSGQFVSAPNLELAYYVAMVGVVMLKVTTREADASVTEALAPPVISQPLHGSPALDTPARVVTLPEWRLQGRDKRSDY